MKRALMAAAVLVLTLAGLAWLPSSATASTDVNARSVATPKAVNGGKVAMSLRSAVRALPVAAENRAGYVRSKFKHWNDVDRDCQDARAEVLKSESKVKTAGKCSITRGKWYSYYDKKTLTSPSGLDIDHMVPLAEAWDSGARAWSANKRQAFANDLTDARSLVAVTASTNRSKSDRDPAEWLPQYGKCRYAFEWTVVKTRWNLRVDLNEKAALTRLADACANRRLVTHKAVVKMAGGSGGGSTGGGGGSAGSGGGGSCTPGYRPCLPPMSDYDCAGGSGNGPGYAHGPIYVTGSDPYDLDSDGDGVACER